MFIIGNSLSENRTIESRFCAGPDKSALNVVFVPNRRASR